MINLNQVEALLLDLDGTLLKIDMEQFLPRYLEDLAGFVQYGGGKDAFTRALLDATFTMVRNTEPTKNNEKVFFESFCSLVNEPQGKWFPLFATYYQKHFSHLQGLTAPMEKAGEIIAAAKSRSLDLVLATNPIFPRTAIEQRLSWAGLKPCDFQLITSLENMHYCKPSTLYFQEILERIRKKPEQCLMVGNDVRDDLPAGRLGISTFLADEMLLNDDGGPVCCNYRGTLKDLLRLLDKARPISQSQSQS